MKKATFAAAAFAAIVTIATSCGTAPAQTEEVTIAPMQVDDVLAGADTLFGDTLTFEGVCTHICSHGGRKIFLMGSDDTKTIRIESGSLGAFAAECVNRVVTVKAVLREERIDEAYLQRWEAALAAQNAEQHGDGEEGCSTEKKARQETANTPEARIADFRAKIAARAEATGKEYLSFAYGEAVEYKIAE